MPLTFADSPRSSVGLEWELALVDQGSRELVNCAPQVLSQLYTDFPADRFPHFTGELLQNTVELVSAPHPRISDATDDLRTLACAAQAQAHALGADLIGSGSHAFSPWQQQLVTENARYERFMQKYRWWGRNMLIWGVHMHIGIDRTERVIPIMHALLTYLPHLLALSASSPFWAGESTGYASNRTLRFQQLPTAGLPIDVNTWAEFEQVVTDLETTDIIAEPTELRWDIRPAPRWGTLEVRFCDGASTLEEIGALAALTQCLVEHSQQQLDQGSALPRLRSWFVRENKWRAARYGLDAVIIVDNTGTQAPLRNEITQLVSSLAPTATALGCETELASIASLLTRGTSAERQLRLFEQLGGAAAGRPALMGVVDSLANELASGLR